jgi:hypothetical protein
VTVVTAHASVPVLRELLDEARSRRYEHGVLGVRAKPEWPGSRTFTHDKVPVRIEPCVSALAVREALLSRQRDEWLIVLTDRSDEDLGAGVLSHFVGHRLRTPDPWAAVRHRFAAIGIDPAIFATASNRDVATGLLAATPPDGWPAAPGGVLTRSHAFGSVAAAHFGLSDAVDDFAAVLGWTADPALAERISDLRTLAGDAVSDAVLAWAAERTGVIAPVVLHLLRGGEARDVVPLGLVAGLLADARGSGSVTDAQIARDALIRLEPRFGGSVLPATALTSWSGEAAAVVSGMLRVSATRTVGETLLARADQVLDGVRAGGLAEGSDLLPSGLTRRFAALAAELRAATATPRTELGPDMALVAKDALDRVERAWANVAAHRLAGTGDRRTPAFHAAVRLTRWLAGSFPWGTALPELLRRHSEQDAWADSAVNDAAAGVSDPDLSAGLATVLDATRIRRSAHDTVFGSELGDYTTDDPADPGVLLIEDLLPKVVMPLARQAPVLLLVLDGMSAGVGTEVTASILDRPRDGWAEALLDGQARRAAALAVLPTLTEVSRASLLTGGLSRGGQDAERKGYAALARAHGLADAPLFHKKPLDTSRPGYAVADDVLAAIADVTRHPLVTCVLNSIDDALDRSDPGGTDWGTAAVKHLDPLLERAQRAGRIVILTADHGHVIDRRQGTQRQYADISSARSRSAAKPKGDGEVLVSGRRVRLHDGTAVLAVDENLRYGPAKSGYHGGASPAETVVPVTVLVPGAVPPDSGLRLAPPQEPSWWIDPVLPSAADVPAPAAAPATLPAVSPPVTSRPSRPKQAKNAQEDITLFDLPKPAPAPEPSGSASAAGPEAAAAAVLASAAYKANKKRAGRVAIEEVKVAALLNALAGSPSHRLAPAAAASALQVPPMMLRGAVSQVQQLLNIDGTAVIRVDADGSTVILDVAALEEQYGISL